MTAPNHALTGALIGLSISNPLLALPLAFVSHLVCDAIPHYDQPGVSAVDRIQSQRFIREQLLVGAGLCFLLVLALAASRPQHWVLAAFCAFTATSPDLLWIPRFVRIKRTGRDVTLRGWYWFHDKIQWRTGPKYIWVEAVWFAVFSYLVLSRL